eukprot:Skav225405  [mRNA]  locus=scaffold2656:538885:544275:+ [translate_table: standard]
MAGDFATDHELWARIGIDWSSEENESCNDCDITHQPTKYSFLSMTLEPKLLRATSLVNALRGWCRHWDPNSATGDAIFEHSRPVDSIDVFLTLGDRLGTLGTYFPLQYVVCVIMSSNIPILSHLIWQISLGPEGDVAGLEYVVWLLRLILWRLQPLLAILFSLELSVRLWKIKSIFPRIPRSFLALLLSPIQSILVSCVFASMELAVRFSDETSLIPLVPFFLGCFVNAILHLC